MLHTANQRDPLEQFIEIARNGNAANRLHPRAVSTQITRCAKTEFAGYGIRPGMHSSQIRHNEILPRLQCRVIRRTSIDFELMLAHSQR